MSQKTKVRRGITIAEQHMDENAESIRELNSIQEKMENFCRSKRNAFMPIRHELEEAQKVVRKISNAVIYAKWHCGFVPQGVGWIVGKKLKEAKEPKGNPDRRSRGNSHITSWEESE